MIGVRAYSQILPKILSPGGPGGARDQIRDAYPESHRSIHCKEASPTCWVDLRAHTHPSLLLALLGLQLECLSPPYYLLPAVTTRYYGLYGLQ